MQKKYTYLLIFFSISLLSSCTEEKASTSLNESEFFFEETLASISKDDIWSHIYYIGSEDGIVYRYNSNNQELEKINTDFDRIYKVVRDSNNYWVGTRNMGLLRCELRNDSFVVMKENGHLNLPAVGKSTNYSAYDISINNSGIFVATSEGLFKVPDVTDGKDTLIFLGPHSYGEGRDDIMPVVAGNIQLYRDQYLLCASDSGLLRVELSSGKCKTIIAQKVIKNIVVRNDSVFSLTGDSVIVTDYDGNGKKGTSFKLKQSAQIYYYDETTQTNYFINDQSIQLVKDADLHNTGRYKIVQIRRPVRSKCHNVIVNDPLHRQSLLVTNHSISRVGHHQDVLNFYGNVKLACTDNDNIYYLVDTKIYRQKKGEQEANPFKDITRGTKDVRFMEVLHDELYYVDSSNEIYKASLYSSYLFNSLFSWDKHIEQATDKKKEVTAIGKDGNNVYVGVRDGLRNLNDLSKDIPLLDPSTNITITNPFITKFVVNGDAVMFCTLNDGIFTGKDNSFTKILGSDSLTFIRDIGIDPNSDNSIYLLTNRGLYHQEKSKFIKQRHLSGYNRLLVLDSAHVYGFSNYGIMNLCDSMDYFVDIPFNSMACISLNNNVYAGSGNGVYAFSSNLSKSKENGIEVAESFNPIDFNEKDYFSRKNILVLVAILLSLVLVLWWYDRHRISQRAVQTYKNGLRLRLDELNTVREHLNSDIVSEIDGLISEVDDVDVSGKSKSLAQLKGISLRIMELTGRVPSMLILILQDQIGQIKKTGLREGSNLIEKTNDSIKVNTLLRLEEQIRTNTQWLTEARSVLGKLSDYETIFKNLPIIAGVTDETAMILKSAKTPQEKVLIIEELLGKMNDESSREKIRKYIDKQIEKSNLAQHDAEVETGCYSMFELIKKDYCDIANRINFQENLTDVIKNIPIVDRDLSTCLILNSIYRHLQAYNNAYNDYENKLKEKEKKAKKGVYALNESLRGKDDKEETERKSRLDAISVKIKKEIDEFYQIIGKGPERGLFNAIAINLKEGEGQFLQAKILALLMTGIDIPVSRFKYLLDVNEQSLRRGKRDLLKQLEIHRQDIANYAVHHDTSIATLLLKLLKTSAND